MEGGRRGLAVVTEHGMVCLAALKGRQCPSRACRDCRWATFHARSSRPLLHVTSRDTIIAFPSLVSSLTRLGHHVPPLRVTALAPKLPPPAAVRVLRDVGVVGRRWRLRTLAGGSAAVKTSTFEEKNVGLNTSVQAHMQLLGSVYEPPAGAQPEPAQPRAAKVSHLFSGPRMSRRRKTRPPKVVHRHRTGAHRASLEPSAGSSS